MSKLLIMYGTVDGQTLKIAERIGEIVRSQNFEIEGINAADDLPPDFQISSYSAIIIGSSLHRGQYNPSVVEFIRNFKPTLEKCPSAFYSVRCVYHYYPANFSIGDATRMRKGVDKCLDKLFEKTGWRPRIVGRFVGALKYPKYDFWTKFFMVLAGWIFGYPTDTHKEHELTDWKQVEMFTNEVLESMKSQQASASA